MTVRSILSLVALVALVVPVMQAVDVDLSGMRYGDLKRAVAEADTAEAMALIRAIPATDDEFLYRVAAESLNDPRPRVVEAAIDAMQAIGGLQLGEELPRIRDLLDYPDARVRWLAVRALGKLEDDLAIGGLIRALGDEAKVARAAHEALVAIMDVDRGTDPAAWHSAYDDWLHVEETLIPEYISRIDTEGASQAERLTALSHLIHLKSHKTTVGDHLARLARDADPMVASLARSALRNFGGVAAIYHPEVLSLPRSPEGAGNPGTGDAPTTPTRRDPARSEVAAKSKGGGGRGITIAVLFLLVVGLGFAGWRMTKKLSSPSARVRARADDSSEAQPDAIQKKRISFTR